MKSANAINIKLFRAGTGKKIKLAKFSTKPEGKSIADDAAKNMLKESRKHLAAIQDKFYAHNTYSMLIIFQAMDAGGKDGAVKHVMSGFNPMGVKVYNFKTPSSTELDHHYLWRHERAMPARGEIAIHNRSHYENVLVTRVHPGYIMNENLPGIDSVKKIDKRFWMKRFRQIRRFEKNLTENGTVILKFFLHLSKNEQKKRFLERIDNPGKNWKFSMTDVKERECWDDYQEAYEEAINETDTNDAPWFIIPADNKDYARLAIAAVITRAFKKLNISYPNLPGKAKSELHRAKEQLLAEEKR